MLSTAPVQGDEHEEVRILVVDDEKVVRDILAEFLTLEGYNVRAVEDGMAALRELHRRSYHVVISDLKMPNMGGLELLQEIGEAKIPVLTIMMTGFATVETAIEAMKKGAHDYFLKPFKVEDVVRVVQRGLDIHRLQQENFRLKEAVCLYQLSEAMTKSLALDTILDIVLMATLQEAQADVASLVLKDPGTGRFVEHNRKYSSDAAAAVHTDSSGGVELNLAEILDHYGQDRPLLAHGIRALKFLAAPPRGRRLVSFCSIPLKVHDQVVGMLNAFSYTHSRKFTEGQRRLLSVLASRAAVSVENARFYQDLVLRNQNLVLRNQDLEHRNKLLQANAALVGLETGCGERTPTALYPHVVGGLTHDAVNTAFALGYQITQMIQGTESCQTGEMDRIVQMKARVDHLERVLRLIQSMSREYYACGEEVGSNPEERIRDIVDRVQTMNPDLCYAAELHACPPESRLPLGVLTFIVGEVLENATRACQGMPGATVKLRLDGTDEECLLVECHDSGPGISETVLAQISAGHIRPPRGPGQGGHGLYLIHEITERLGGSLLAANEEEPGHGARVQIILPTSGRLT